MDFIDILREKVKKERKRIVLPEGLDEKIIISVSKLIKADILDLILIGDEEKIKAKALELNVNIDKAKIVNPYKFENINYYIESLYNLRKHKGMTMEDASKLIYDEIYFGTMMVKLDDADGLVAGISHLTSEVLKPALKLIKTTPYKRLVSSFIVMLVPDCEYGEDGVLFFADCAVVQNPDSEQLATIAIDTALSAESIFDIKPKVALLSYTTKSNLEIETVTKIRTALELVKERKPNLLIDGELQLDAALDKDVAKKKAPNSDVAGNANVLIFPNLEAGNIGYKLVERLGKATSIGPICQGFDKPVNDLSRGASINDIILTVIVTAIQAQFVGDKRYL